MIFIIQQANGEEYEEYYKWNDRVYEIDATKGKILDEWKKFMINKFTEVGIIISHTHFNVFYVDQQHLGKKKSLYEKPKMKKEIQRKYNKIIKENNFITWLESNYNAKLLKFEEIDI